ncbi:hypothetical protein WICPIJ_004018 [Wickerhamomyces pijperi]|uniref:Uncharacterized protein n=1 Tax=Wickerhamomyces pijperi TaxID=599730 RepID=A0A9P8Q6M8_WICPI|nr:hypothetical protein WICPIJ_004018 [Wickerhamomyces pijperi]
MARPSDNCSSSSMAFGLESSTSAKSSSTSSPFSCSLHSSPCRMVSYPSWSELYDSESDPGSPKYGSSSASISFPSSSSPSSSSFSGCSSYSPSESSSIRLITLVLVDGLNIDCTSPGFVLSVLSPGKISLKSSVFS